MGKAKQNLIQRMRELAAANNGYVDWEVARRRGWKRWQFKYAMHILQARGEEGWRYDDEVDVVVGVDAGGG